MRCSVAAGVPNQPGVLAGTSIEYYVRLERGDARGVSQDVLDEIAQAATTQINTLTSTDFTTITLDRSGRFNRPTVHETTACG